MTRNVVKNFLFESSSNGTGLIGDVDAKIQFDPIISKLYT